MIIEAQWWALRSFSISCAASSETTASASYSLSVDRAHG